MSRRTPLELKLPLLMSFVLATVLGIALVATNATLRRAQVTTVSERLLRGTRQMATLGTVGLGTFQARFVPVGQDSTIRRALRTPTGTAPNVSVKAALARLEQPTDSGMPIELWSADGRRLAFIGDDVPPPVTGRGPGQPELRSATGRTTALDGPVTKDPESAVLTPLYSESNRVYFWISIPIRDNGQTIGYFRQQRRLGLGPSAIRTLRELSGDSVSLYYRNADGAFWTFPTGQAFPAFQRINGSPGTARDSVGDRVFYSEERIGLTPLYVGMSVPERTVMLRPRRTTNSILLLSAVLMFGGVLLSWAIGRSVARPIADITDAAGLLATGDFSTRVPVTGEVEVRRLAHSFNHMAEEIAASRAALEQQTREAQAANRAKSEFLTTMSHELRTPLNAIGGYVDLIEMELRGPISDAQRRDLQRIKTSQQHLLGLISSVLDLGRIEAGQVTYHLAPIPVDPMLEGIDTLVAPQAAAKTVSLDYTACAPSLAVVADREKVRQILLNLLSNAIKYTPAQGVVSLSAEDRGDRVAIIVEDTGPGVPVDKREVIFEPFVQLDRSLSQTIEGLGLGLAISRDLARGMRGDLAVESGAGGGARFVLTLPRGPADAVAMLRSDDLPTGRDIAQSTA